VLRRGLGRDPPAIEPKLACRLQQIHPGDFLALTILALRSGTPGPTLTATH
jgi:hypothetical protein